MKVVGHPYLKGVKCREDGAVWIPNNGRAGGPHWTFGSGGQTGYHYVVVNRRRLAVHRLICEAFHGLCPPDKCQVDHINRARDDNRPENLRWVSRSENNKNTPAHEASVAKYGVSWADDRSAYMRAYYANNPEYREKQRARDRAYCAKNKLTKT